jgi:chromosome segregation ATPase
MSGEWARIARELEGDCDCDCDELRAERDAALAEARQLRDNLNEAWMERSDAEHQLQSALDSALTMLQQRDRAWADRRALRDVAVLNENEHGDNVSVTIPIEAWRAFNLPAVAAVAEGAEDRGQTDG